MCPNDLIALVTALAAAIAEGKTIDELALLTAIFSQLGDTLGTIAAQRQICEDLQNRNNKNNLPL